MATRLFVGNLPDNISEDDLRSAFSSYGQITNLDLKSKSAAPSDENKKFAFVTISGSNHDIETCIRIFSNQDFNGNRLYVTRARESFLERLQRERLEAKQREADKSDEHRVAQKTPVLNLSDKLNPRKRQIDDDEPSRHNRSKVFNENGEGPDVLLEKKKDKIKNKHNKDNNDKTNNKILLDNTNCLQNGDAVEQRIGNVLDIQKKKQKLDSDKKRLDAMKKKSQEFKQKKMIVKTGLTGVDKVTNKKIKFSDNEDEITDTGFENKSTGSVKKNMLFDNDDGDSGNELNFEIKEQFEGIKGQKVLDLQSRYKSDKRFILDERFVEDDETENDKDNIEGDNEVELNQEDEKTKQLNILQDLLGVPMRKKAPEDKKDDKKNKPKLGMLRFDPSQPDHVKFLAPVDDTKQESTKKTKKKKDKGLEIEVQEQKSEEPKPEVSKEQFYRISDTLKEAIVQPTAFSLRSLFGNTETTEKESKDEHDDYIPLEKPKKSKVKNPLEPGERNPFVYDSSDSENEHVGVEENPKSDIAPVVENKAVWKESFFFGLTDPRFDEGLAFFTNAHEEVQKERRELKSLMKKRIYNKERKDQMQMFRKKIGGRKKTMKKSFRR